MLKVAIIGSGNIGTDLMVKCLRKKSGPLLLVAMAGVDPKSDGLARAARLGVSTTHHGIDGLLHLADYPEIGIVFDATSASAHEKHAEILHRDGKLVIDMTPAAVGPFVVPSVNLDEHLNAVNVNMVTCGGQATIPIVAAIARVAPIVYAEIVASIASKSAGPGTRANIDEFTETTSRAIETVEGAARGKAIIVLNPAEPPLMMRDTVFALVETDDTEALRSSIEAMIAEVQAYVPGYRLKQAIQFEPFVDGKTSGQQTKVTILLEVEGAAHYLPAYAGNLDIMTSAALRTAERIAERRLGAAA